MTDSEEKGREGPTPIQFPIDAKHLQQDMEIFPAAVEKFMARLIEQAKGLRRQVRAWPMVPGGSAPGGSGIIPK